MGRTHDEWCASRLDEESCDCVVRDLQAQDAQIARLTEESAIYQVERDAARNLLTATIAHSGKLAKALTKAHAALVMWLNTADPAYLRLLDEIEPLVDRAYADGPEVAAMPDRLKPRL